MLGAALACSQLGPDLDSVVAIEIVLPDSGFLQVDDTLDPHARPLNGRGDSVAATVYWGALDTAVVALVDSETGAAVGKTVGTGRIQARVGRLPSNPVTLVVQPPLDSIRADGAVRDTVTGSTSGALSDSLRVRVFATMPAGLTEAQTLVRRRVTYALLVFPSAGATVTLVPNDTIFTNTGGLAAVQVRLDAGAPPDSVRVTASAAQRDGTPVPDAVTFVVEFRP
ncbi:MAG: hypothetical protein ACREMJ_10945 [Gemmatimonadales bacterium]